MANASQEKLKTLVDFRKGRITRNAVNFSLAALNSVSNSWNVNFDTIIGAGVVRPGTTILGSTVANGETPLGLSTFVGSGGSPNMLLSVFPGAATATVYNYTGTWSASGLTNLSNTSKVRFAQLGGSVFLCNGAVMLSSADGNTWGSTNCPSTITPSLILQTSARLITAGYPPYKDRVYFSSIIAQNTSPFLTWNEDPSSGDWISINPDDGGNITAFAETSTVVLVWKNTGMYRLDVVNKAATPENIFPKGAYSQEGVVVCQGNAYFFGGDGIYSSDGTYPQLISRLGVQDLIKSIPSSYWSTVALGTDGFNVYCSLGSFTINGFTYSNVVAKWSVLDQTWSLHYYAQNFNFFTQYTDTNGNLMRGADTAGEVQTVNLGTTDNGANINYDLETQELDFGGREELKQISDHLVVMTQNGLDSHIQVKADDEDYANVDGNLNDRVNILDINAEGYFFKFRWFGTSSGKAPILEGFYVPTISYKGITKK